MTIIQQPIENVHVHVKLVNYEDLLQFFGFDCALVKLRKQYFVTGKKHFINFEKKLEIHGVTLF